MKYLFLVMCASLVACTKQKGLNVVIDIGFSMLVENSKGENLLKKTTPNAINAEALQLSYWINEKKLNIYNSDMDCPTGICPINDANFVGISVLPNHTEDYEYPLTFIKWENGDIDTIKCYFKRFEGDDSGITCDKVWYNDVQMFPNNALTGFGRAFKIVK